MLRVEHMVHRDQPDILVHPAIAGHEMRIEQFIVVDGGVIARI